MISFPWIAVAALVALVFTALAARAALPPREIRDVSDDAESASAVPPAPLQRVAWWTLAAGAAFVAAVAGLIVRNGVQAFWVDQRVRLPITALMLAAIIASLTPMLLARGRVTQRVLVDERDLAILAWAPRVQGPAVLVCLALWTVVLMEAFHAQGQVPVVFVVLVMWSCLLVHALALPAGILLGYRRR